MPTRLSTTRASGTPNAAAVTDEKTFVMNALSDQKPARSPHQPSPNSSTPKPHSRAAQARNLRGFHSRSPAHARPTSQPLPERLDHQPPDATPHRARGPREPSEPCMADRPAAPTRCSVSLGGSTYASPCPSAATRSSARPCAPGCRRSTSDERCREQERHRTSR